MPARRPVLAGLGSALRVPGFGRLLAVFAVNGIAAAIPSATVLFFVADVLGATTFAGAFLVLYFAAAAASLPLWVRVSQRIGKLRAWLAGMGLAVAVFGWAATIGQGDLLAYGAICVLSGMALGADSACRPRCSPTCWRGRGTTRSSAVATRMRAPASAGGTS